MKINVDAFYLVFPFLTSHWSTVLTLPVSAGVYNTATSLLSCGPRTPDGGVKENWETTSSSRNCFRIKAKDKTKGLSGITKVMLNFVFLFKLSRCSLYEQ